MIWVIVVLFRWLIDSGGQHRAPFVLQHHCPLSAAPRYHATRDVVGPCPIRPSVAKLAWGALRSGPENQSIGYGF